MITDIQRQKQENPRPDSLDYSHNSGFRVRHTRVQVSLRAGTTLVCRIEHTRVHTLSPNVKDLNTNTMHHVPDFEHMDVFYFRCIL